MRKLLSFGILLILISALTGCSTAGKLYKSGKDYIESGNYKEAEKKFSAAVAKNPNRADYYIDYGMSLIAVGKYQEAIKQFDRVYMDKDIRMVRENNKRALRGKGITYYYMMKYKEAIEQFDMALKIRELSELDMDILYYKGSSLMAVGENEKASEIYTSIIELDSNNSEALFDRACVYHSMGDFKNSLADFDKAISLYPNNYDYYFGKYSLLSDFGKNEQASEVLKQAAKIKVSTNKDKYNLAKVHYFQGDYDTAMSELNVGFANGFNEAYYYIGEIYRNTKDYKSAVYYYDKYLEEGSTLSSAAYNQASTCLFKLGDYTKALSYIKKGLDFKQTGSQQTLRKNEAIAYENLGQYDKAYHILNQYLKDYPKDKEAEREIDFIKTRLIVMNDNSSHEE